MTDNQFDVLDELYFVISFDELLNLVDLSEEILINTLESLYTKGWIKVLSDVDEEVGEDAINWVQNTQSYYFLVTKRGLLAHNSQS